MNINFNQLATSISESLKALTVSNYEDDEKGLSLQDKYIDSIEFSDRAIELSTKADTDTGPKEGPGTNQQQGPAFTNAMSLNFFA